VEFDSEWKFGKGSKDSCLEVVLGGHAGSGGDEEALLGRGELFQEALAVRVLVVFQIGVSRADMPKSEVLTCSIGPQLACCLVRQTSSCSPHPRKLSSGQQ
jgi:hypothetical protein